MPYVYAHVLLCLRRLIGCVAAEYSAQGESVCLPDLTEGTLPKHAAPWVVPYATERVEEWTHCRDPYISGVLPFGESLPKPATKTGKKGRIKTSLTLEGTSRQKEKKIEMEMGRRSLSSVAVV